MYHVNDVFAQVSTTRWLLVFIIPAWKLTNEDEAASRVGVSFPLVQIFSLLNESKASCLCFSRMTDFPSSKKSRLFISLEKNTTKHPRKCDLASRGEKVRTGNRPEEMQKFLER